MHLEVDEYFDQQKNGISKERMKNGITYGYIFNGSELSELH